MFDYGNIINNGDDFSLPEPKQPTKVMREEPEPNIEEEPEVEPDDPAAVQRYRLLLKLYLLEFSDKLKAYKSKLAKVDEMCLDDLKCLQQEVSMSLSVGNVYKGATKAALMALKMIEGLSMLTPIKINGLTKQVEEDEILMNDIKLMCLDACSTVYMKPYQRVALSIGAKAFNLHYSNTVMERLDAERKIEVKPEIKVINQPQVSQQQTSTPNETSTKITIENNFHRINKEYADL